MFSTYLKSLHEIDISVYKVILIFTAKRITYFSLIHRLFYSFHTYIPTWFTSRSMLLHWFILYLCSNLRFSASVSMIKIDTVHDIQVIQNVINPFIVVVVIEIFLSNITHISCLSNTILIISVLISVPVISVFISVCI